MLLGTQQQTQATHHATLDPKASFRALNINQEVTKLVKKDTQNIVKKKNRLVFVASLWQKAIIPTFYMHKDDLWCVDSCILPRRQQ